VTRPLVSIVLPVHNQGDHVETVVEDILDRLDPIPASSELLLVVNGCTDHTADVCARLASTHERVRVETSDAGGWGRAVKIGIAAARGDLVCYTNSARTSADDLAALVSLALANPSVVVKANRRIRERLVRRAGSLLYNLECRALFDLSNWDVNGTPKIFPRSFDKLLHLREEGDLIDLEFTLVCRRERYPIVEVPIFSSRRRGGRSTTGVASALHLYLGAVRLWRSRRGTD
jgi:glycosyltransferase involved in cell wall biosynthesis